MLQVRNFEKVGLTRQQAEALTEHLTEVLCTHKEKLSEAYVTKAQLEKVRLSLDPMAPAPHFLLEVLVSLVVTRYIFHLTCADSSKMCLCLQSVLEGISRDAGFKSEVLKAQDMHHTTLNRESERLANDVSKVRAEIR